LFVIVTERLFPAMLVTVTRTDAAGLPAASRICPLIIASGVCPSAGKQPIKATRNKRFIITDRV
jgi:hypothetical protein